MRSPPGARSSATGRCGPTTARSAGLEVLAQFAAGAPQLDWESGCCPSIASTAQIAADVDRLGLDPAKLLIGIGSGRLRPALQPVRAAVAELRRLLPDARVVVGAMRPAALPPRRRARRRRVAQLDVAGSCRASSRLGTRGRRGRGADPADHRVVRPRRRRTRCHAAVARRGGQVPPADRGALRGDGRPARHRRCRGGGAVRGRRGVGAVPAGGRPHHRSCARRSGTSPRWSPSPRRPRRSATPRRSRSRPGRTARS